MMISAPDGKPALARDTVFAAVMIVCNGIVGLCLLGRRRASSRTGISDPGRERCAGGAGGPHDSHAGAAERRDHHGRCPTSARRSLSLRELFRWCSTARSCSSRPCGTATISSRKTATKEDAHADRRPTRPRSSVPAILLASLVAVVGLAKALTPTVETGVASFGASEARRGYRDCRAGASAGRPGGAARGAGQPAADQPEPGFGLGAREHWPDDSDGRGSFDCASTATSNLDSMPKSRSCWR